MFTLTDICDIAIQIERNGEAVYRHAARAAADPEMAELLRWMAAEEERHACFFAKMTADVSLTPEQAQAEAMGRSLLQEMIRDKTFSLDSEGLAQAEDLDQVLSQSKVFEEDTILFYEFLQGIVDDDVKGQLSAIILEERRHAQLLAEMLDVRPEGATRGDR
jgi:rubrerythrin